MGQVLLPGTGDDRMFGPADALGRGDLAMSLGEAWRRVWLRSTSKYYLRYLSYIYEYQGTKYLESN